MSSDDKTRLYAPVSNATVGTQLSGIYELDEWLASGGMGEVYRGHNIQTGDLVAIKIVLPEFARDQTILSLFRKEASILNRLSHDAIVRYHVFTIDPGIGRPYLAMEFVNGDSLFDVMKRGPMPPAEARKLGHRLASGLSAAHEAGTIHRDLSPDNIILPDGRVERAKIIDFGIARSAATGGETLIGGKFAGKYNYVSPEQLGLFGGEITERSDIYSLGLVLAAALRGKALDMSGSQFETVEKRRTVPDLSDIDDSLRSTIETMLQPDPQGRPASMADVADAMRDAEATVNPLPSQVAPPGTSTPGIKPGIDQRAASPGIAGGGEHFVPHVRPALLSQPRSRPPPASFPGKTSTPPARPSRKALMAGLVGALAVAAGGSYLAFRAMDRGSVAPSPEISQLTPAPVTSSAPSSKPRGAEMAVEKGAPPPDARELPKQSAKTVAPASQNVAAIETPGSQDLASSVQHRVPSPEQREKALPDQPLEPKPDSARSVLKSEPVQVGTGPAVQPRPARKNVQTDALPTTPAPAVTAPPASSSPGKAQELPEAAPLSKAATAKAATTVEPSTHGNEVAREAPVPAKNPPAGTEAHLTPPAPAVPPARSPKPAPWVAQPEPSPGQGVGKPAEQAVAVYVPQPVAPTEPPRQAIDDVARRISWLRDYKDGGDCFYASATSATDKAIDIEGFGTDVQPFARMLKAFQSTFHLEPDISVRLIEPAQCEVTHFLSALQASATDKPELVLDRTSVPSGTPISGYLATRGGLRSSLLLIDHRGMTFNLDDRVTIEDGKAVFSIPIGLGPADLASGKDIPQIIVAVTGSSELQSASFSNPTPASIALPQILAEIRRNGSDFSATAKYFRLGG